MKKITILVIVSFFFFGCGKNNENIVDDMNGKVISCSQLEEMKKENDTAILVDVRTEEEYLENHLTDAINIPLDDILNNVGMDDIDKDVPIIVYCRSGSRSSEAMSKLISEGYKYVYDLGSINKC